jgi:hypothetical protein
MDNLAIHDQPSSPSLHWRLSYLICTLVISVPFVEPTHRPMSHIHSDPITDCPGSSGKKKGLLIAIKDNTLKGFSKLNHAQGDAKRVQRLLIGILSIYLLLLHAR